jgi:hypothetical protein
VRWHVLRLPLKLHSLKQAGALPMRSPDEILALQTKAIEHLDAAVAITGAVEIEQ